MTLHPQTHGPDVAAWQQFLTSKCLLSSQADGIFGPRTFQATVAYQSRVGLHADGAVGPKTWAKAKADGFVEPKPHLSAAVVHPNVAAPTTTARNYDIKDASVRVPTTMHSIATGIALDYDLQKKTTHRLMVTSGTRTAEEQASAMRHKLDKGEKIEHLYANKTAVQEIIAAYKSAPPNTAARNEAMAKVIKAQTSKGTYISQHLVDGGLDFRDPQGADGILLRQIIDSRTDVTRIKEGDHIHIQLKHAR